MGSRTAAASTEIEARRARRHEVGREIAERLEHERPLGDAGMGHGEIGLGDLPLAVQQQVEIERTRLVAHAAALAALAALDREQLLEQDARRELGRQACRRIEIGALSSGSDRSRLVDARRHHVAHAAQRAQRRESGPELPLAVAEIGAERDEGELVANARGLRAAQMPDRPAQHVALGADCARSGPTRFGNALAARAR